MASQKDIFSPPGHDHDFRSLFGVNPRSAPRRGSFSSSSLACPDCPRPHIPAAYLEDHYTNVGADPRVHSATPPLLLHSIIYSQRTTRLQQDLLLSEKQEEFAKIEFAFEQAAASNTFAGSDDASDLDSDSYSLSQTSYEGGILADFTTFAAPFFLGSAPMASAKSRYSVVQWQDEVAPLCSLVTSFPAACIVNDPTPPPRMRNPIDEPLVALGSLFDRCQSTLKKMRRQPERVLSERDRRHDPGIVYDNKYSPSKKYRFKRKRKILLKRSKSLSALRRRVPSFHVRSSSPNTSVNGSITVPKASKSRSMKRLFSRKHEDSSSITAKLPKAYSMRSIFSKKGAATGPELPKAYSMKSIFSSKKRDKEPGRNITKSKREIFARFFGRKTEVSDVPEEAEVEEVGEEDGEEEEDQELSFSIEEMDDEANEEIGSAVSGESISFRDSWASGTEVEDEFAFDLLDYHIQELQEESIPFTVAHRPDHSPPGTPTSEWHNLIPEAQPEDNREEFMKPQYWLKRKGDYATIAFDTPAGFGQDSNLSDYYKMPLFEPAPPSSKRTEWTDALSYASTDSSTSDDDENITYEVDKLLPPAQSMILYLRGKGWRTQRIAEVLATLDDDFVYKHGARWYKRHKFPDHTGFDDEIVKRIRELAPCPRMPWDNEFDPEGKSYPEAFRFLKNRMRITVADRFVKKVLENYFYYRFTKTVYHMILNWPA